VCRNAVRNAVHWRIGWDNLLSGPVSNIIIIIIIIMINVLIKVTQGHSAASPSVSLWHTGVTCPSRVLITESVMLFITRPASMGEQDTKYFETTFYVEYPMIVES